MERRDAFTLIELLVVIAIIALLVSILMPSLQKAKEMAKDVVCLSNQKSIALAMMLYAHDYDDYLPYSRSWDEGLPSFSWSERVGKVPANCVNWKIRGTPEERLWLAGYIDYNMNSKTEGHFKCPSAWDQVEPKPNNAGAWEHQFSANEALVKGFRYEKDAYSIRLAGVNSGIILIGDCSLSPGGGWYPGTVLRGQDGLRHGMGPWPYVTVLGLWSTPVSVDYYGHTGEKSNLAFVDGHAESKQDLREDDFLPD
jgi:prepilin-type N-terminal cleavage/methylation domain-containing protein/prepilin-type processing-associated H-X9-DG protein